MPSRDFQGGFMLRNRVSIAAVLVLSAALIATASAQQMASPAPDAPKMSRFKMTREKIRDMRAKWQANRPKLRACRKEARQKGLAGDDRWFFMSECMEKA
jgi:hypothetical protein